MVTGMAWLRLGCARIGLGDIRGGADAMKKCTDTLHEVADGAESEAAFLSPELKFYCVLLNLYLATSADDIRSLENTLLQVRKPLQPPSQSSRTMRCYKRGKSCGCTPSECVAEAARSYDDFCSSITGTTPPVAAAKPQHLSEWPRLAAACAAAGAAHSARPGPDRVCCAAPARPQPMAAAPCSKCSAMWCRSLVAGSSPQNPPPRRVLRPLIATLPRSFPPASRLPQFRLSVSDPGLLTDVHHAPHAPHQTVGTTPLPSPPGIHTAQHAARTARLRCRACRRCSRRRRRAQARSGRLSWRLYRRTASCCTARSTATRTRPSSTRSSIRSPCCTGLPAAARRTSLSCNTSTARGCTPRRTTCSTRGTLCKRASRFDLTPPPHPTTPPNKHRGHVQHAPPLSTPLLPSHPSQDMAWFRHRSKLVCCMVPEAARPP